MPEGAPLDGHSFAPLLTGGDFEPREFAFAEHGGRKWLRTKDYKLYSDGKLYHVVADPREKNVIDPNKQSPAAAAARKRLQARMNELTGR